MEDNIKMDHKEKEWKNLELIIVAQNTESWRVVDWTAMKHQVS